MMTPIHKIFKKYLLNISLSNLTLDSFRVAKVLIFTKCKL